MNNPKGFSALLSWLQAGGVIVSDVHACMEATGVYGESLATFLHDQGFYVSVVNGARLCTKRAFSNQDR
jgi:transposase